MPISVDRRPYIIGVGGQGVFREGLESKVVSLPQVGRVPQIVNSMLETAAAPSENPVVESVRRQSRIMYYEAALYDAFTQTTDMGHKKPVAFSGHSLGLPIALYAAGAYDLPTLNTIVTKRAQHMAEASRSFPGKMGIVMGLQLDSIVGIIKDMKDKVNTQRISDKLPPLSNMLGISNDNSPIQFVLSGIDEDIVKEALRLAKTRGASLARTLEGIVGVSHTRLIKQAASNLYEDLKSIVIDGPEIPVYANTQLKRLKTSDDIRRELSSALCKPVRWSNFVGGMLQKGQDTFVELAASKFLESTVKQTHEHMVKDGKKVPEVIYVYSVTDKASLDALRAA